LESKKNLADFILEFSDLQVACSVDKKKPAKAGFFGVNTGKYCLNINDLR
jgi:hypothetical protein